MTSIDERYREHVLLDEPLNSRAFGVILRSLGLFAAVLAVLIGLGLLWEEAFFRRAVVLQGLLVLILMTLPPLLLAFAMGRVRKVLFIDGASEVLGVRVFWGERPIRTSRVRLDEIQRVEVRKFPPWDLGTPAGLRQFLLIAHLEDGRTEHLAQVATLEKAEQVASALRKT